MVDTLEQSVRREVSKDPETPGRFIELISLRQEDLDRGRPDYHIYAQQMRIGRIYRTHHSNVAWFWGVNAVISDNRSGISMYGQALSFEEAAKNVREAFDEWILWAQSIPEDDPKHSIAAEQLRRIGIP